MKKLKDLIQEKRYNWDAEDDDDKEKIIEDIGWKIVGHIRKILKQVKNDIDTAFKDEINKANVPAKLKQRVKNDLENYVYEYIGDVDFKNDILDDNINF